MCACLCVCVCLSRPLFLPIKSLPVLGCVSIEKLSLCAHVAYNRTVLMLSLCVSLCARVCFRREIIDQVRGPGGRALSLIKAAASRAVKDGDILSVCTSCLWSGRTRSPGVTPSSGRGFERNQGKARRAVVLMVDGEPTSPTHKTFAWKRVQCVE